MDAEPFELISSKDNYNADKALIMTTLAKLLRSEQITLEDKGGIIHCMHTQSLRSALGEALVEINSPKVLNDMECLR